MIIYNSQEQIFHMSNPQISYIVGVENNGVVTQLYYGRKIDKYPMGKHRNTALDTAHIEYPGFGTGDFREPAYVIQHNNGSQRTDFRYERFEQYKGKSAIEGLPSSFGKKTEVETLVLYLKDQLSELELILTYSIFDGNGPITRSVKIINHGESSVVINKIATMSLDLEGCDFDLIQLSGAWGNERNIVRQGIHNGIYAIDSKRGASSHQQNPFMALADPNTDEQQGDVYGFSLIYSGNHKFLVDQSQTKQTRIQVGINDFNFAWQLNPDESFQTPEVVMVYSENGFNGMSHVFHQFFTNHLINQHFAKTPRPVLLNNWEATYMDFTENKLLEMCKLAKTVGVELFVLDDGWFGHRDDDSSSLGDWFEYPGKIASGLAGLSQQIHELGLQFGLWFEPEMISPDSELFKAHPEWALGNPNRERTLGRNQYVIDFSRKDVRDAIYHMMTEIIDEVGIDYIKWDLNRNITDYYSFTLSAACEGEFSHRYILGLYEFMDKITHAYPQILFEGCAGGGGRFDAGILYYFPQIWTSDNTDAIDRLKIQYGTSLVYPPSTMGSHVSVSPNEQNGRMTNIQTRGDVAAAGTLGYELDLTQLSEVELKIIKQQITEYKEHRELIQFGDFFRLQSPFDTGACAWQFVSKDKSETLVIFINTQAKINAPKVTVKPVQLDMAKQYRFQDTLITGEDIMKVGIEIPQDIMGHGDFRSIKYYLRENK